MPRIFLVSLVLAACATTGAVESALHGDLTTLRTRLAEEKRRGDLDQGRVTEIAHAVAAREIYAGSGRAAARRIHSLRGCSKPLLGDLDERAERLDEGGAEATLVLLASGRLRHAGLVERYAEADSGAWRAVAARAATTGEYFALRRKYFADSDERVRRAALEAANEAPAVLDFEGLMEAARLDPDPMARSLAVRAVGRLGGERASRGLRDLWERAEEDVRMSILGAFAAKATFTAGGREALLREAEAGRGVTAVAAAGELLARGRRVSRNGGSRCSFARSMTATRTRSVSPSCSRRSITPPWWPRSKRRAPPIPTCASPPSRSSPPFPQSEAGARRAPQAREKLDGERAGEPGARALGGRKRRAQVSHGPRVQGRAPPRSRRPRAARARRLLERGDAARRRQRRSARPDGVYDPREKLGARPRSPERLRRSDPDCLPVP